ncbi:MAG: hypothetical protein ACLFPR_06010, partial [Desulfococcaceae bacterium]
MAAKLGAFSMASTPPSRSEACRSWSMAMGASAASGVTPYRVVVPETSLATASIMPPVGLSAAGMKTSPSGPRSPAVPASGAPP